MLIDVAYREGNNQHKLSFTDTEFMRATGVGWKSASQQVRINYVKKLLTMQKVRNENFCYLIPTS